ncbi:hypothetical protein WMY93_020320 [Mugilogobius chulae]|uniref:Uncharacterized protein n=1 Tax=Mugilogobius chulae TaxID=88201 RepID=A0AAW0NLN2_9GOBI
MRRGSGRAARENATGKSTGERDGPRQNETSHGRTRLSAGERDGPRENEAVRGRTGRPGRTRRSAGERDGPRENEAVRGRTGRPGRTRRSAGERGGLRENETAHGRTRRFAGDAIRRYGPVDAADHGDGDSKRHVGRTHVTAHVQKERKGRRRLS